METVFVLLPVHGRREVTRRFIACLAAQTYPSRRLILLDDGSTDGTADMVRELVPSAVVLTGTGDWWWAGALQAGYRWLRAQEVPPGDVVLIANDDTEFDPDFLERGVALLRENERTLVGAQAFDRRTGRLLDQGRHVDWRRLTFGEVASPQEVNCLSTRGLFLRMGDFQAIGGFRPWLLPHYLSDYEFTIRAGRRGFILLCHPSLKLRMDQETTGYHQPSGESFGAFLRRYFSRKSALNPLAWTAFLALACPWPWKAWHLLGTWKNAAAAVLAAAVRSARGPR